ncbi:hypothetical protein [Gordonia aichiensis]|uniref:Uncharacterized protein n=1 Tax=Gordonia aichiensis NBRC 108223 TaxID=1220583 RepID=L7KS75_9ACTN|nr:hypothetical protein [Gordonia aichiensis]GAC50812.1 hypothetical protein GOACH_31_00160 [Gordonia aichiensis NBRC 108223]
MSADDDSILTALGISPDDVQAPPAGVFEHALSDAFASDAPADDSTVPVMDDEPAVPDDDLVVDDGVHHEGPDEGHDGGTDHDGDAIPADPAVLHGNDDPTLQHDEASGGHEVDLADHDYGDHDGSGFHDGGDYHL